MASLASSGIKALSSLFARSWSRKALRVLRKSAANSAQELDELMSTMRTASIRGRGGSARTRWGTSPIATAPEFLFGRHEDVEIKWVHGNRDLHPFAPASDDREHRGTEVGDPHVMLELRHVLFGGSFLREGSRKHELVLEHRLRALHDSVEGGHHPRNCRMPDPALHVADPSAGAALIP